MAERFLQRLIAYELVIKPILVRVCGERYLAISKLPPTIAATEVSVLHIQRRRVST